MTLNELSGALVAIVSAAAVEFGRVDESAWRLKPAPNRWSRIEELGHLIDSANNNHVRFVRALVQDQFEGPGYPQDDLVRVQRYQEADVELVTTLWASYNRLLAHVIAQIPATKAATLCRVGSDEPITLEELALDYVAHLEYHLRRILPRAASIPYTGMPWPPQR